ncbi:MAG TPA: putative glycoside hydrolase, partial [Terriglobales bacterium]|nr:putative glycoside hydrolase [Terriglobales bacterium]
MAGSVCALLVAAAATPAPNTGRHPTPPNLEIRAIYLTGLMAGSPHGRRLAQQWRAEGGNAVVFDVKDSDGPVSFNADLPLASHLKHPYIANLPEWVQWLHQQGLYAIARIAVFKDERLVHEHPELAVHSRATGGVWLENGKPTWTDPSLLAVQNYNVALAVEVADAGVDEIQFDYIRFPVDGNQRDARFAYQSSDPKA